jgi:predicted AAA+ superfamily ATPase
MLDFVKRLIEQQKVVREQVVFIDFSHYAGQTIDPLLLLEEYYKTAPHPDLPPFFIFDEVQDIANLRQLILHLFNHQYKIFMSGSNSKLLASELSTHFRGRIFEYKVYPLSYEEILSFKGIPKQKVYATVDLAQIKRIYLEIFAFGSFPEIILTENSFVKKELLKGYLDILLYKDLLERYKIDNEYALNYLLKRLTLSFTKAININKIYNDLKSQNIKVGKNSLYDYYEHIKNVFYGIEMENAYTVLRGEKKFYLYNLGFHSIFGKSPDIGQSFENIVFLELKKKFDKVAFKQNKKEIANEIDFYIPAFDTYPYQKDFHMQACYQLNSSNFEREISPLRNADGEKCIIYFEKEPDIPDEMDGVKIMDFFTFVHEYLQP